MTWGAGRPAPFLFCRVAANLWFGCGRRCGPLLPDDLNAGMSLAMERLFSDPAYKGFVLQDKKRLPGRFFARMCGSLLSRAA